MEEPPKKPKKKKNYNSKTTKISIRYPHAEVANFKLTAKKLGNTDLAEYLRLKIKSGTITVRYVDTKFDKLIYELNMIGNNLRQSVQLFYKYKDPIGIGEDIAKTLAEINSLLAQTSTLISGYNTQEKKEKI